MANVGLFFYVNGRLLTDLVDIDHAELYGECKIGKTSHLEIWDERYYKIYNKPYDYFPRGRVVFKFNEAKFVLYADKCIEENGITKILEIFDIENENITIDKTDIHYVCKKCNKDYCE
jgi:hypothetical protein